MTYIINPIWFYLLEIMGNAKVLFIILAILSGAATVVCLMIAYDSYGEKEAKWIINAKKCVPAIFIFTALAVFIPSKETLMQIMIAKYATYENADSAIQAIKSAADYVIEAAGKLK